MIAEQAEPELFPVAVTQDIDRAFEAVLVFYGWQHLQVQKLAESTYSAGGIEFEIRCESLATAEQAASGCPYHLSASIDGGQTWESITSLVRSRRLHKVVRTDPIASSMDTIEDQDEDSPSESQAPISLADLARMPRRMYSRDSDGPSHQHPGGYDQ